jgi:hypothetical protein
MPVTGGADQLGCGNRQSGLPHAVNRQSPMGFWSQGALKKKKMKRGYIWQMANKSCRWVPFCFIFIFYFFMAFLCVSQQGEFKNTIKNFFGKIYVKNFWPKKLRKKNFFPFVFSHRLSFIAFLAVSLHEEPKNTTKKNQT